MQNTIQNRVGDRHFAIDTTFVLFFLAVDCGQSLVSPGIADIFSIGTLGGLLVLPYFLPSESEKPDFNTWLLGRTLIAVFAVALGMIFRQTLGVILPEAFRFLPMTLLVLTAMLSCYLQLCAMIRFRLAR